MKNSVQKPVLLLMALMLSVSLIYGQKPKAKDKEIKSQADPVEAVSLSVFKLRSIGPALTSGRISDIAVNPKNNKEFYVAAAAGGVWKTVNGGITFDPIFDNEGSFSIGCVVIDPNNSNVVWVGTGENNNQRSLSYGDGLYKSVNGGKTWTNVGLKKSEHIGMVTIDPRNSDIVYVAAYGPVWSEGGDRGIYKTTDGGKTWDKILYVSENTGFNEIHMDPRNPDVLYAAAHQRRRRQWTYVGGGPESGLYKSVDAGKTWIAINSGLPAGDKGRIGLAISPADPEMIYAVVEAQEGKSGFYRSTDRGASWERRSSMVSSGNYYQELVADPVNPDRVYLMNTFTMVTDDGGATFRMRGEKSKHYDNHCLWIDPLDNNHVIEGTDGGVYESFDNENWRMFTNLPVTQFYKVSVDNAFPFYNVMGGTQDNYSLVGPSNTLSDHGIVSSDWIVTVTGDGFESVVDPADPNIVYAQAQHGNISRFDKRSGEFTDIQPKPGKGEKEYNWHWDAPLMVSPHDNKTLYFAANKLFKSTDRGDSWTAISGDLDRNIDRNLLPVMGKVWPMDAVAKNGSTSRYGAIVSMDESRLVKGLIYAGTDDGQISITENDGSSWRQVNKFPGVPEFAFVYDIIADKHDQNVVYAVFNNHKAGDFKPYICKSNDKGQTWTLISGNLPDGAVYALEQDHVKGDILFAGTEYGLFVTLNGGKTWKQLKSGMPTINVRDIAIQERENDVVVATFGRGFYILDDYSPMREINSAAIESKGYLFKVKDALIFNTWRPLGGLGSKEKGFQGEDYFSAPNREQGAVFTYWVKDDVKSLRAERESREKEAFKKGEPIPYPTPDQYRMEEEEAPSFLIFTITDENNNFVRELRAPLRKGINRITWDLAYPADYSVTERNESPTVSLPSSNIFVLPGTYSVKMTENRKGVVTNLGDKVSFEVKELNNRTIPAADRKAMTEFKKKALELDNAVRAVSGAIAEMESRIPSYKAAVKGLQGEKALSLMNELTELEKAVKEVKVLVTGDPLAGPLDLDGDYSLRSRSRNAISDVLGSTSDVTGTSLRNYEIAAEEFAPLLEKTKSLKDKFTEMDKKLSALGAPLTPGRLPDWKR